MKKLRQINLSDVRIKDAFWDETIALVREKAIPYQWESLNDRVPGAEPSHCIHNFEVVAGRRQGAFRGMVFQDSDLYKWLESVAYSLSTSPDEKLMTVADGAIELIAAAQQADGYLNTYFTLHPEQRWGNLEQGHELYCAGHLFEAAVAYFQATGKRALLEVAQRFANHIDKKFGPNEGQCHGYPGHQVVELALCKLADAAGEPRYLKLAQYFLSARGGDPCYFDEEKQGPGYRAIFPEIAALPKTYSQSHKPPVEQREACGHSVRAAYMYAGMAELAGRPDGEGLIPACVALYESCAGRQMYVTGAIGSTAHGESFTGPYDLPNDLVYGETCASVGLMMFCQRMHAISGHMKYIDTLERALYNAVLSCVSRAGTEFFYVNPLEVEPERIAVSPEFAHIKSVRQRWFACSCCPPNLARTVMSLGGYLYCVDDEGLFVNLYVSSDATFETAQGSRRVSLRTLYPYGDKASLSLTGGPLTLTLRSPAMSPIRAVSVDGVTRPFNEADGAVVLACEGRGETVTVLFDLTPRLVYADLRVSADIGKAAVQRGPLVYCLEQADNGPGLAACLLDPKSPPDTAAPPRGLPDTAVALTVAGYRYTAPGDQQRLYTTRPPMLAKTRLTFIPYYLWANRGENEMRVFVAVRA